MSIKSFAILVIFQIITSSLTGQENHPGRLTHLINYEMGSNWLKEEILIPKVHKGTINSFSYGFERNKQNYYSVQLTIGYGKLKTALETEKVTRNLQITLDYSMGYKIWSNEKLNYLLGYNIKYSWSVMEYPVWDESRVYWSSGLSTGPFNRLMVITKNSNLWITSWGLSLLGIQSRPDEVRLYAQEEASFLSIVNTTHSNSRFGSINSILISNFKTEYRIPLKKGRYVSFSYTLLYSKTAKRNEPALIINRNNVGLGLGL